MASTICFLINVRNVRIGQSFQTMVTPAAVPIDTDSARNDVLVLAIKIAKERALDAVPHWIPNDIEAEAVSFQILPRLAKFINN